MTSPGATRVTEVYQAAQSEPLNRWVAREQLRPGSSYWRMCMTTRLSPNCVVLALLDYNRRRNACESAGHQSDCHDARDRRRFGGQIFPTSASMTFGPLMPRG